MQEIIPGLSKVLSQRFAEVTEVNCEKFFRSPGQKSNQCSPKYDPGVRATALRHSITESLLFTLSDNFYGECLTVYRPNPRCKVLEKLAVIQLVEVTRFIWNPNVLCRVHKSHPMLTQKLLISILILSSIYAKFSQVVSFSHACCVS
jgi:hypothetical protein